jgi:hypothetical protein
MGMSETSSNVADGGVLEFESRTWSHDVHLYIDLVCTYKITCLHTHPLSSNTPTLQAVHYNNNDAILNPT